MNELEIKEQVLNFRTEIENIINIAEAEKRELTENEINTIEEKRLKINELDAVLNTNKDKEERKINNKMGILKLINAVVEGRSFDEQAQAEQAEIRSEMAKSGIAAKGQIVLRSITSTDAGVGKDAQAINLAARNNSILGQLGCTFISGAVGDIVVPCMGASQVTWKGETAGADATGSMSEVELKPKRLTAFVDVSKQFLLQNSEDAEAMIMRDLENAISEKLDATIFGAGKDANQPTGLFNGVSASGSADYASVLEIEEKIETANGIDYVFVCSPKVKMALKATATPSDKAVYEGNELDGYKAISSNGVVSNGVVALVPEDLVVAQWGALDITVDPLSQASNGNVRLVVNGYFDAAMKSNRIAKKIFA